MKKMVLLRRLCKLSSWLALNLAYRNKEVLASFQRTGCWHLSKINIRISVSTRLEDLKIWRFGERLGGNELHYPDSLCLKLPSKLTSM